MPDPTDTPPQPDAEMPEALKKMALYPGPKPVFYGHEASVTKVILLVSSTYPLPAYIVLDKAGKYKWIPEADLANELSQGATQPPGSLIAPGCADANVAWTHLIKRYSNGAFQNAGWQLFAIKPYDVGDVNKAIKAIKDQCPNLVRFVFHYFGHGDSYEQIIHHQKSRIHTYTPFLEIEPMGKIPFGNTEVSAPTANGRDDPTQKYYTHDLVDFLFRTFAAKSVSDITVVLDGCDLGGSLAYAITTKTPQVRVVTADHREPQSVVECLFSAVFYKYVIPATYDNYPNDMPLTLAAAKDNEKLRKAELTQPTNIGYKPGQNP